MGPNENYTEMCFYKVGKDQLQEWMGSMKLVITQGYVAPITCFLSSRILSVEERRYRCDTAAAIRETAVYD